MKSYVVIIGEYEDQHIGFCSNNLDSTVDFINTHFNCKNNYNEFNIMECWEENKQIFIYGENRSDIVCCKSTVTKEELMIDIQKYIAIN